MPPVDSSVKVRSGINVTPLVDVVLVLLIIFMIVAPRLQSDGLDSSGRVTAQPFSSWVTEPNRFGDKPAVGQMPDLGLPTLIQQYCGVIKERLDLLTDAYLHGFDMEEMCGIANMCGNKRLGIYLNNEPTTVKARAFQAIAG